MYNSTGLLLYEAADIVFTAVLVYCYIKQRFTLCTAVLMYCYIQHSKLRVQLY